MSILDDLYNGRIYPFEQIVPADKNYRPVNAKVGEMRDFISAAPPVPCARASRLRRSSSTAGLRNASSMS